VLEWARRADAAGFSALGTLDRPIYSNWEPLVALGAGAAATERIGLMTAVLLLPYRQNAAVVAKHPARALGWPAHARRRHRLARRGLHRVRPIGD